MKLSTRGQYGLRAMLELALRHGEGPVALKIIAEKQGLSEHYLEQLMGALRKAGLVTSVRGAQGGYELSAPPDEIRAGDVIRVLEGPIAPVECVDEDGAEEACERMECCPTRTLWKQLKEAMVDVLDSTTLGDLCEEAGRLAQQSHPPMYYI